MVYKANISMDSTLYGWLRAISSRMGARSVPGVARAILIAVMHASESKDAAIGMISMIQTIQSDDSIGEDLYIDTMMAELSDADRIDPRQRTNINRRT